MDERDKWLDIRPIECGWKVTINGVDLHFDTWAEVLQYLTELGV